MSRLIKHSDGAIVRVNDDGSRTLIQAGRGTPGEKHDNAALRKALGPDRWPTYESLGERVVKALGSDVEALARRCDEIQRLEQTARGMPVASDLAAGYRQRISDLRHDPKAKIDATRPTAESKSAAPTGPFLTPWMRSWIGRP